jgi:propionyl-CoA carboxylase alpha chain
MKFWITLEGREAEVEFHTEGERLLLEIEGRTIEADFHRLPDGEVYSLLVDGRSHEVRVARAAEGLEVTHQGAVLPVMVRRPIEKVLLQTQRGTTAAAGETVRAPMPGLVVALRVAVGDRVQAGQAVAVVEAMKMQNELAAKHGGIVSEVLVAERASVSAGQPLVRLRPEPS